MLAGRDDLNGKVHTNGDFGEKVDGLRRLDLNF